MDKEVERRIALLHALIGAVVGAWMGMNYRTPEPLSIITVAIIGLIISAPMMIVTQKLFSLPPDEFQIKDWLSKGFVNFFLSWLLVWIFLFNLF